MCDAPQKAGGGVGMPGRRNKGQKGVVVMGLEAGGNELSAPCPPPCPRLAPHTHKTSNREGWGRVCSISGGFCRGSMTGRARGTGLPGGAKSRAEERQW